MAKMGTICPPIRAMPSDLNTHPAMIDRAIETFAPIHRMGRWCVFVRMQHGPVLQDIYRWLARRRRIDRFPY
jgi:hypothetical protein